MNNYKRLYLTLRRIIGVLAFALPVILIIGGLILKQNPLPSLSDYYLSDMRDAFVGCLFTIGFFLIAYPGYDLLDKILCKVAAVCLVATAIFPIGSILHPIAAATLFFALAYISFFLFTKTNQNSPTSEKKKRNTVYRVCGIVIGACLLLVGSSELWPYIFQGDYWTLILEIILLWSFGISWMVKGQVLIKDKVKKLNVDVFPYYLDL